MRPHFQQIVNRVSTAVAAHYSVLGDNLVHSAPNETQRIKALVNVRVAQMRDNDTIAEFSELIGRYYPELEQPVYLEELHSI